MNHIRIESTVFRELRKKARELQDAETQALKEDPHDGTYQDLMEQRESLRDYLVNTLVELLRL